MHTRESRMGSGKTQRGAAAPLLTRIRFGLPKLDMWKTELSPNGCVARTDVSIDHVIEGTYYHVLGRARRSPVCSNKIVAWSGSLGHVFPGILDKLHGRIVVTKASIAADALGHALLELIQGQLSSDASSISIGLPARRDRTLHEHLLLRRQLTADRTYTHLCIAAPVAHDAIGDPALLRSELRGRSTQGCTLIVSSVLSDATIDPALLRRYTKSH
jgi:hypothetical protein